MRIFLSKWTTLSIALFNFAVALLPPVFSLMSLGNLVVGILLFALFIYEVKQEKSS